MPDQVLERLAHYPGISSQLEMIDVATPYAWWRYTRNHKGAYEVGSPEIINAHPFSQGVLGQGLCPSG